MALNRFSSLGEIMPAGDNKFSGYTTNAKNVYKGVFGDSLCFPIDLGSSPGGTHYTVFYINELLGGKYSDSISTRLSKDSPVMMQSGGTNFFAQESKIVGKENELKTGSQKNSKDSTIDQTSEKKVSAISSQYARTTVCIALPIPEILNTQLDTAWNTFDASSLMDVLSVGNDVAQQYKDSGYTSAAARGAGAIFERGISELGRQIIGRENEALRSKRIRNPRKEMLFDNILHRRFSFQWTFYPRTPEESKAVWDIIQMFKYHQLPEYDEKTSGFFIKFPNTFDIEFHSNGKRNDWIPKSSTCALQRMDINYTPGGSYAFFKEMNEGKNMPQGSAPVGVTIALEFAELEQLYRNRIDSKGDYTFNQNDKGPRGGTF